MRHNKHTSKFNRTSSHRRCMTANMLKSLIEHGQIETTVPKAKELKRHADKLVTLAKKNTLAARRRAIAKLMIRFNPLTAKQKKAAKKGDTTSYNGDRVVVNKLFDVLGKQYEQRPGGYTRIRRLAVKRTGDNTQLCLLQYVD